VRKHLSDLKGGGLAGAAAGAGQAVTLVLSDVVGDPVEVIASGPTVPDPSTYADALAVFEGRGADVAAVRAHLAKGVAGELPETPKSWEELVSQTIAVVGSGRTAAEAAAGEARRLGLDVRVVGIDITGSAAAAAARLVGEGRHLPSGGMAVFAGETTVEVLGAGRGGRNQELALAAALLLDGEPAVVVASLGTDGVDGPTDAAGGVADGTTVERGRRIGLNAAAALVANDSNTFLAAVGDLLITGPTGTNVGDLMVAFRS
jgi:glycerate 2-kinase